MKKILLLLAILPMFMTSCSNDDESTEQTFFVNVYTKWEDSEEKVAKKAFLYIYENENKSIDNSQSTISRGLGDVYKRQHIRTEANLPNPNMLLNFNPVYSILKICPMENTYYGLPIGKNMGGVPIHLTKQSA